jgi:hypothetical protein
MFAIIEAGKITWSVIQKETGYETIVDFFEQYVIPNGFNKPHLVAYVNNTLLCLDSKNFKDITVSDRIQKVREFAESGIVDGNYVLFGARGEDSTTYSQRSRNANQISGLDNLYYTWLGYMSSLSCSGIFFHVKNPVVYQYFYRALDSYIQYLDTAKAPVANMIQTWFGLYIVGSVVEKYQGIELNRFCRENIDKGYFNGKGWVKQFFSLSHLIETVEFFAYKAGQKDSYYGYRKMDLNFPKRLSSRFMINYPEAKYLNFYQNYNSSNTFLFILENLLADKIIFKPNKYKKSDEFNFEAIYLETMLPEQHIELAKKFAIILAETKNKQKSTAYEIKSFTSKPSITHAEFTGFAQSLIYDFKCTEPEFVKDVTFSINGLSKEQLNYFYKLVNISL